LLFATGEQIDEDFTTDDDPRLPALQQALDSVLLDLAHQIVRDGEGATKFVEVTVTGAADDAAAKTIGLAIANSPLVKTALAAEDANWGRIVMAVGKSGEAADRDKLELWLGSEQVTADGAVVPTYSEARATAHLQQDEVQIRVDVGVGEGRATVWTCDLTHGYVEINAGYRS
jgi:glutamate N-acetyltransferase/amino-acid N-acetyltransferase